MARNLFPNKGQQMKRKPRPLDIISIFTVYPDSKEIRMSDCDDTTLMYLQLDRAKKLYKWLGQAIKYLEGRKR